MGRMKCFLVALGLALAGGCAGPSRSFDVVVHNQSELPVTLWLTKSGPPQEKGWYTPDEFVKAPPDTPSPGVQLPPGKTADTGNVSGTFPRGTDAILLVYRAGRSADVIGKSEPLLVKLHPGKTELAVNADSTGRLYVYNPIISTTNPIAIEP